MVKLDIIFALGKKKQILTYEFKKNIEELEELLKESCIYVDMYNNTFAADRISEGNKLFMYPCCRLSDKKESCFES